VSLPNPDALDAIIFDFGGVLFDIDYPAPARAFKSLGVKQFEDLYSKASQNDLFDRLEVGAISNEDFLDELQTLTGGTLSIAQIAWAWNTILTGIPKERIDHQYGVYR
jgi:putative hydrolase of the HAD superfamily